MARACRHDSATIASVDAIRPPRPVRDVPETRPTRVRRPILTGGRELTVVNATGMLAHLDARDRALFSRWALGTGAVRRHRWMWTAFTHLGGVWIAIAAATMPLLAGGALGEAAADALATLAVSHALVQLVKRSVGRPRPSLGTGWSPLAIEPDRFSFPSGHAAAAMSIGFVYACAFPVLALPLITAATAVGLSRVVLGVHYPGDVLAGQTLAVITGVVVLAL